MAGFLPKINALMKKNGQKKQFHHLLGITLGTGLGAGLIINGELHLGDNSMASELWMMRHPGQEASFIEESISIRGIRRMYADLTGQTLSQTPNPEEIFRIAEGVLKGDRDAAAACFRQLGQRIGYVLYNANCLIDGLIVIGGGLSGSSRFFMPALIHEMNRPLHNQEGRVIGRPIEVFNLEDEVSCRRFLNGEYQNIQIYGTGQSLKVNTKKTTGVGLSILGTNRAIALGAAIYALRELDRIRG